MVTQSTLMSFCFFVFCCVLSFFVLFDLSNRESPVPTWKSLYQECKDAGFTEEQSFELVKEFVPQT